jgi:hypothetical protein
MEDHDGVKLELIKLVSMWIISHCIRDFHETAANVFITLSILYLLWKWRRDYLKG